MKVGKWLHYTIIFLLIFTWVFSGWPQIFNNPIFPPTVEEAKAASVTRANTVEFMGGYYSGNGTTGLNSNTDQTFSTFNFRLAEDSVDIKHAFIAVYIYFEAYANNSGNYTGWELAFDVCEETCTATAFSGSGNVNVVDSTVVAYDETEGNYVRLLMDVTSETQLAAYTGSYTEVEAQIGFRVNRSAAVNSIASAAAKLFVTYEYAASSESFTNTVVYPLDSNGSGDQGSYRSDMATVCTKNSTCPTLAYNMEISELGQRIDAWFDINYQRDTGSASDRTINVNIQEDGDPDTDSANFIDESANGGGQGHSKDIFYSVDQDVNWTGGASGFAENSAQNLEFYASDGDYSIIGGMVYETYMASTSAATKTKTVRYPLGEINPNLTTTEITKSVQVYLPEDGVDVKSAFVRVVSSLGNSGANDISVRTKVGSNASSSQWAYTSDAPSSNTNNDIEIIHIIASSDYTKLETASATSSVQINVSTQLSDVTRSGGTSGELIITYTYTGETYGYLTSLTHFAGMQTTAPSQSYSTSAGLIDLTSPEVTGTKTVRGAALEFSWTISASDGTAGTADRLAGANLTKSPTGCSASNTFTAQDDAANTKQRLFKDVTSVIDDLDATYTACYSNNGSGDPSNGGAKHSGILYYIYQLDVPNFDQVVWKWFGNYNGTEVNMALANQNASTTLASSGDQFRLRLLIHVTNGSSTEDIFKLQFATSTVGGCDTSFSGETYYDVSPSAGYIRFYDNASPADSDLLTSTTTDPTHGSDTIVNQTYEEANNFTVTSTIVIGNDGKWDFSLVDNSAPADTTYCFRVVKFDNTLLDTYTEIPEIQTASAGGVLSIGIVDSGGSPVATPSSTMSAISLGFGCQTSSGTLGVNYERIRVTNTTANPQWSLTISTSTTAYWDGVTADYDFNDAAGTPQGCSDGGGDADGLAGQMSIDPSGGINIPQGGCSTTGITFGSGDYFGETTTSTITLSTASGGADTGCYWDLTDMDISQQVPAEQDINNYSLYMVITVTAI